jgi:hypothetical protein
MRVICPFCSHKALITSRNSFNDENTISDLYCICTNTKDCAATFVYTLAYKHVINPPARTTAEIALNLVNRMTKEEKASLRHNLFTDPA